MRNDYDSNYLIHHGILGQKWGVRRFQNPDGSLTDDGKKRYGSDNIANITTAKGMTKRLNDLDNARARNLRDYSESSGLYTHYNRKASKAKSDEKRSKYQEKAKAEQEKYSKALEYMKKGREETDALLAAANKRGYKVNSSDCMRDVTRGKDVIQQLAMTAAFDIALVATTGYYMVPLAVGTRTTGTSYKVKELKKK